MNITPENKCYDNINSLVTSFASLYFALEYQRLGNVTCGPGDYVILEGLSSGKMLRLPIWGPIEAVLNNLKPNSIEITVEDLTPSTQKFINNITVLNKTIDHIILPHLIIFYENNISNAEIKFNKKNYSKWPASWRMGWVIRNALSHNYCIHYKDKETPSVTWRLLEISPAMQGKPIEKIINFTDIMLLILDMENDLNE